MVVHSTIYHLQWKGWRVCRYLNVYCGHLEQRSGSWHTILMDPVVEPNIQDPVSSQAQCHLPASGSDSNRISRQCLAHTIQHKFGAWSQMNMHVHPVTVNYTCWSKGGATGPAPSQPVSVCFIQVSRVRLGGFQLYKGSCAGTLSGVIPLLGQHEFMKRGPVCPKARVSLRRTAMLGREIKFVLGLRRGQRPWEALVEARVMPTSLSSSFCFGGPLVPGSKLPTC
nr:uncharacterized protein LOC110566982 isoform X1 [Aotus nancymaae]